MAGLPFMPDTSDFLEPLPFHEMLIERLRNAENHYTLVWAEDLLIHTIIPPEHASEVLQAYEEALSRILIQPSRSDVYEEITSRLNRHIGI